VPRLQHALCLTAVALGAAVAPAALEGPRPIARSDAEAAISLPLAASGTISGVLGRDQSTYHARPVRGGFQMANAPQQLRAHFSASGVAVRAGRATVGFSLLAWGYGGALRPVAPAVPQAEANRVSLQRGPLAEWYVNGPLGLEQGFTLRTPPARHGSGPLTLDLAVSSDVTLDRDRRGLRFRGTALRYSALSAVDAAGRSLAAWIDARAHTFSIRVADAGARYPVTIDPFLQQAKLTASDSLPQDRVGVSVAVAGDVVVLGAPGADVAGRAGAGAAYVFVKPASGWASTYQTAKLTASDGQTGDSLGSSVAISGDTIIAGAPGVDVDGRLSQGAAYVFTKPSSGWASGAEQAKLTASDGRGGDDFGSAVAIDGTTAVVGAPLACVRASCGAQGTAYVFTRAAFIGWGQVAKLTASDAYYGDQLGTSVAVSGDTVVAAAPDADAQLYGDDKGTAYVFEKPAGGWADANESTEIAPGAESVAIQGRTIVVGMPEGGGAWVYVKLVAGGGWAWVADLLTFEHVNCKLGTSVAIDGRTVVVGAPRAYSDQGAVYVYVEPDGGWSGTQYEHARLMASDGQASDLFGTSVAVSGDTVVGGAPAALVVNRTGTAYVFGQPVATTTALTSSHNPSYVGEQVTYTAFVSPVPSGGTVAFFDGGAFISGCESKPVDTSTGQATCQVTYSSTGTHEITETYSGNANYAGSSSSPFTQTVVARPAADLSVAKVDDPDPVQPGGTITYTITVHNGGPMAAPNAVASDNLPAQTTLTGGDPPPSGWACSVTTSTVTCTNPSFASGATATFRFTVQVYSSATGTISNTASITSDAADSNSANDSATAQTRVGTPTAVAVRSRRAARATCKPKRTTVNGHPATVECGPAKATVQYGGKTFTFSGGTCKRTNAPFPAVAFSLYIGTKVTGGVSPHLFFAFGDIKRDGTYTPANLNVGFQEKGVAYSLRDGKTSVTGHLRKGTFRGNTIVFGKGKLGAKGKPMWGSFTC
jgi:uncharacterized repeat protein (TIGR01451 family)